MVQRLSSSEQRGTPVACLQTILEGLNPQERELVRHSLFLGVAKNSFQLHGSGDSDAPAFLVRNLIGVDPRTGSVAVGERLRVGQRVQFQLRDANASRQENANCSAASAGGSRNPWQRCCLPAWGGAKVSTASPMVM